MEPQGLYNLSVENQAEWRKPTRVGLLRGRTGVPAFLLFLQGISQANRVELTSLEDVESEMNKATSADKHAWESILPFFEAEGTLAHAVTIPVSSDRPSLLAEMIGQDLGLKRRTGIHALKSCIEFCDIAVVPQASLLLNNQEHGIFYQSLFEILEPLSHYFILMDFPRTMTIETIQNSIKGGICANAAAYYPWLIKEGKIVLPAPVVAAHFQASDASFGINDIPANRTLRGGFAPLMNYTPTQVQNWLGHRINVFHRFSTGEIRVWGGRTLADPMDLDAKFISNQRTLLAVKEAVHQICEPFVLEPLHEGLAKLVEVAMDSTFQPLRRLFNPESKHPFRSDISIVRRGTEDVLQVNVSYSVPTALDEVSFSLGLAG